MFKNLIACIKMHTFLFNDRKSSLANEIISAILNDKDAKIFERRGARILIISKGILFSFWIANKFYAYLSECYHAVYDANSDHLYFKSDCQQTWDNQRPSADLMWKFYQRFEVDPWRQK